jgi:hypothetical protein
LGIVDICTLTRLFIPHPVLTEGKTYLGKYVKRRGRERVWEREGVGWRQCDGEVFGKL